MQLSVVILNYNVRYFLELCLKSVQASISNLDAEIIIVDNLSSDDSCQMVKELFPEVILIENKENYGFSKGNNIGVAKAKGDFVCILNPDTVIAEDTFKILLEYAESIPKLGIIGCKLVDGNGYFLPESKRNVPSPLISIKKILGDSSAYYANHLREGEIGEVDVLVGAFMLLERKVYNEIGGFDEDYFMYGEDMDFSYRILKAGYKNYYNPSTTIINYKGESTFRDKVYVKRFNEAMQIFFKKHYKPNLVYNTFIWIGIKIIILINLKPKLKKSIVHEYVLLADKMNQELESKLQKPITLYTDNAAFSDYQQLIFDNEFMDFKGIITFMTKSNKTSNLTYKILPKKAQFIIGSNSSVSRGEVIAF